VFQRAIIRPPGSNFVGGLTTAGIGLPIYTTVLQQYERYCVALKQCGLALTRLEPDPDYPDSTFVEDTAVLTARAAVLARPGAPSRMGEAARMRDVLTQFYPELQSIHPPGTLDGGDICEAGDHFFIGISERTNETGAEQLAALLAGAGYTSNYIDIRGMPGLLHLKSGLAYLGDRRLAVVAALAKREAFCGYDLVSPQVGEEYAANCLLVNDHLLVAAGYPAFESLMRDLGYNLIVLEMSEFRKMDGGLSCLSLRF
jgi:dimethylargininase